MIKRIQAVNSETEAVQIFVKKTLSAQDPTYYCLRFADEKSEVYLPKPATTHMHFRQQMLWRLIIGPRRISGSFSSAKCRGWIPIKSDFSDICWRIQTFFFIGSYGTSFRHTTGTEGRLTAREIQRFFLAALSLRGNTLVPRT